jgi:hypothetical protein
VPISTSGEGFASRGSLATVGASTALAVYDEYDGVASRVYLRRSTDSGRNWGAATLVSTSTTAARPAIAAFNTDVDVVWAEGSGCGGIGGSCRIRYARSTDGGATFGASIALSPSTGAAGYARVARGSNGRVVVAWTDWTTGRVQARVSTTGGASFGGAKAIVTTSNDPFDDDVREAWPAVAVGKGVIYVAYFKNWYTVQVRRSLDNGASWATAKKIAGNGNGWEQLDAVAQGTAAYVG